MKIFISVDMEGIAGIVSNYEEYNERKIYRDSLHFQIESVIKGIKSSKKNDEIEEITICDSHGLGKSLVYEELSKFDDRISLISGYPRTEYMIHSIDNSYSGIIFLGYHSGAGTLHGNMEHSFSSKVIHKIYINDIKVNEAIVNAIYCRDLGIPVILIIGDDKLKKELDSLEILNNIPFVITKESISRYAAKYKPRKKLEKETIEKTKKSFEYPVFDKLPKFKFPYNLKIEFHKSLMADIVELLPPVKRVDAYTVEYDNLNSKELVNAILSIATLAGTAE